MIEVWSGIRPSMSGPPLSSPAISVNPSEDEDEDEADLDEERRERHSQQPTVAQSDEQADNSQVCLNVRVHDPRLAVVPFSQWRLCSLFIARWWTRVSRSGVSHMPHPWSLSNMVLRLGFLNWTIAELLKTFMRTSQYKQLHTSKLFFFFSIARFTLMWFHHMIWFWYWRLRRVIRCCCSLILVHRSLRRQWISY